MLKKTTFYSYFKVLFYTYYHKTLTFVNESIHNY